jgi:hypothetical protein
MVPTWQPYSWMSLVQNTYIQEIYLCFTQSLNSVTNTARRLHLVTNTTLTVVRCTWWPIHAERMKSTLHAVSCWFNSAYSWWRISCWRNARHTWWPVSPWRHAVCTPWLTACMLPLVTSKKLAACTPHVVAIITLKACNLHFVIKITLIAYSLYLVTGTSLTACTPYD